MCSKLRERNLVPLIRAAMLHFGNTAARNVTKGEKT